MKRELKFRVWDIACGEYIECINDRLRFTCDGIASIPNSYSVNCIVEQYTNQKDKNGKEIYEGDIVYDRVTSCCPDTRMDMFVVIYDYTYSAFVLRTRDGESNNWIRNVSTYGEVIGNIHETEKLFAAVK